LVPQNEFSNAVSICDRLDFVIDIAICDVIYPTQSKKPIPFENRLESDLKIVIISIPFGTGSECLVNFNLCPLLKFLPFYALSQATFPEWFSR
jgi:hypothetical protein